MGNYLAHISYDGREQSVIKHAKNTAEYAAAALEDVGLRHTAYLCGFLHDLGKNTSAFQSYILAQGNIAKGSVNHTFAGPKYILTKFHKENGETYEDVAAEIIAYAMAAHHGQFDIVDEKHRSGFQHREAAEDICYDEALTAFIDEQTEKEISCLFTKAVAELEPRLQRICDIAGEKCDDEVAFYSGLLARLLLSAVVEGDRRDTAEFFNDKTYETINCDKSFWENSLNIVEARLKNMPAETLIRQTRRYFSQRCKDAAQGKSGIYRLNLPTGGGKTLSGLRFALEHAKTHGKKRIIFTAPLLSILDQNADVIREFIQNDNIILEHHSNIVRENTWDENDADRQELLAENWNSPIIITTLVQLLNTLFEGNNSSVRRMHSLCNSVIVIDEVQSVPVKMLTLFNLAINFLTEICNTTVLLCSATQPCLEKAHHPLLDKAMDIVPYDEEKWKVFDRTEIIDSGGVLLENIPEFIAERLTDTHSLLVACNKRKEAEYIFRALESVDTQKFFLSAGMCSAHRRSTLQKMKNHLAVVNEKNKVICVSTQVIEAGVDISFGCVVRIAAGLDSIIQAAGRCNRNGETDRRSPVYVVRCLDENLSRLKEIKRAQDAAVAVLNTYSKDRGKYDNNLASDKAVKAYYESLYRNMEGGGQDFPVEEGSIYDFLSENITYANDMYKCADKYYLRQAFKTAGNLFKVFDDNTYDVIVPYGEGEELIANMYSERALRDIAYMQQQVEKAKHYSISLYNYQYEKLLKEGRIKTIADGRVSILDATHYDREHIGFTETGEKPQGIFI